MTVGYPPTGINSYKEWRRWFKTRSLSFKWFLYLILLRPVIDIFWSLKYSGFYSPLQIVGILTPLFVILSYLSITTKKINYHKGDIYFLIFGVLYCFNYIWLFFEDYTLRSFGQSVKFINPVLIYFYLRKVVINKSDIHGILYTFFYSSFFPLSLLLYEIIFGSIGQTMLTPMGADMLTASRGGGVRLQGLYADLFNYASFLIGDFFIVSYFLISTAKGKKRKNLSRYFIFILLINIFGLIGIKHSATIGVFFCLFAIFLIYNLESGSLKYILVSLFLLLIIFSNLNFNQTIAPIFSKEISAIEGRMNYEFALNGRIYSWFKQLEYWSETNIFNHLFGVASTDSNIPKKAMMMNAIGDYPRIMFSAGIIGIVSYLMFYIYLFNITNKFNRDDRYLVRSAMAIMLLYSLTLSPFGYSTTLLLMIISIFSYALRNKKTDYFIRR